LPSADETQEGPQISSRHTPCADMSAHGVSRLLWEHTMLRAFFLAMGISTCIYGAECLVVERFVLAGEVTPSGPGQAAAFNASARPPREMVPPEWAPWSLLASGALVVLYSMAMRRE